MVRITHQPPLQPTTVNPQQRTHAVEPAEPTNKHSASIPEKETRFVERRRQDRRSRKGSRGRFDMRCGRDRRKNSDTPSVDVDV